MQIIPIIGLIFGPIIGAIIIGLIQLGIYHGVAAVGLMNRENIPMFPILLFRGLLILLALIALGSFAAMYFKGDGIDPLMSMLVSTGSYRS